MNHSLTNLNFVVEHEQVPNGIGCFLGVIQLVLYAIYRNAKPSKSDLSAKLIEEGSQQPNLISSPSNQPPKKDVKW